jgi:hypothetical protein
MEKKYFNYGPDGQVMVRTSKGEVKYIPEYLAEQRQLLINTDLEIVPKVEFITGDEDEPEPEEAESETQPEIEPEVFEEKPKKGKPKQK